ncbi:zinc ribbon domain-containing protein [Tenuibacillus multivorans]
MQSRSHSGHRYYPRPHHHNPPQQGTTNTQTQTCHNCQSQIPAGSKFCLQCGEKVNTSSFCTGCGEKLPAGAKFCSNCGTKI